MHTKRLPELWHPTAGHAPESDAREAPADVDFVVV